MGAAFKLDDACQRQVDEHLDSIEEVLRDAGMPRSERQNILDDVETQIVEMLSARTQGNPTVEDVKAVIAELDPPESYAPDGEGSQRKQSETVVAAPRLKKWTMERIAFSLSIAGIVVPGVYALAVTFVFSILQEIAGQRLFHGFYLDSYYMFAAFHASAIVLGAVKRRTLLGRAAMTVSSLLLGGSFLLLVIRFFLYS